MASSTRRGSRAGAPPCVCPRLARRPRPAAIAAARPGPALVVDMTRTRFCDSAGLHALIGVHKRAQDEGRHLRLAVTGAQVRRILALTALDRLIPVCTSLDQALDHPPAAPATAAREQDR
jgi:ABC-type transporter Mla MlaB component